MASDSAWDLFFRRSSLGYEEEDLGEFFDPLAATRRDAYGVGIPKTTYQRARDNELEPQEPSGPFINALKVGRDLLSDAVTLPMQPAFKAVEGFKRLGALAGGGLGIAGQEELPTESALAREAFDRSRRGLATTERVAEVVAPAVLSLPFFKGVMGKVPIPGTATSRAIPATLAAAGRTIPVAARATTPAVQIGLNLGQRMHPLARAAMDSYFAATMGMSAVEAAQRTIEELQAEGFTPEAAGNAAQAVVDTAFAVGAAGGAVRSFKDFRSRARAAAQQAQQAAPPGTAPWGLPPGPPGPPAPGSPGTAITRSTRPAELPGPGETGIVDAEILPPDAGRPAGLRPSRLPPGPPEPLPPPVDLYGLEARRTAEQAARDAERADMARLVDERLARLRGEQPRLLPEATLEPRAPDRRQQTANVAEERRLEQRRAVAQELQLPEEHPAVQRILEAETERDTDALTTLPNRRAHDRAIESEGIEGHASLDLAGLKRVNDTISHDAGDQLLRQASAVMKAEAERLGGTLYRRGGDEFAIGARDEAHALEIARAVKERLAASTIEAVDLSGNVVDTFKGTRVDYGYAGGRGQKAFDQADRFLKAYRERAEQLPPEHPEHRQPYRPVKPERGGVRELAEGTPGGRDAPTQEVTPARPETFEEFVQRTTGERAPNDFQTVRALQRQYLEANPNVDPNTFRPGARRAQSPPSPAAVEPERTRVDVDAAMAEADAQVQALVPRAEAESELRALGKVLQGTDLRKNPDFMEQTGISIPGVDKKGLVRAIKEDADNPIYTAAVGQLQETLAGQKMREAAGGGGEEGPAPIATIERVPDAFGGAPTYRLKVDGETVYNPADKTPHAFDSESEAAEYASSMGAVFEEPGDRPSQVSPPSEREPSRGTEITAAGEQALIPGTLDAAAAGPRRPTQGKEAEGPLFTADADAKARREEEAFKAAQRPLAEPPKPAPTLGADMLKERPPAPLAPRPEKAAALAEHLRHRIRAIDTQIKQAEGAKAKTRDPREQNRLDGFGAPATTPAMPPPQLPSAAPQTATEPTTKPGRYGPLAVTFTSKPAAAVREGLRNAGFRWDKDAAEWSAPSTPAAIAAAQTAGKRGGTVRGIEQPAEKPWLSDVADERATGARQTIERIEGDEIHAILERGPEGIQYTIRDNDTGNPLEMSKFYDNVDRARTVARQRLNVVVAPKLEEKKPVTPQVEPDWKYALPSFATGAPLAPPVTKAPPKPILEMEAPPEHASLAAEPAHEPAPADRGALERAPAAAIPRLEEERPTGDRASGSDRADEEGVPRRDGQRDVERPGVGAGAPGVGVPAGEREREPSLRADDSVEAAADIVAEESPALAAEVRAVTQRQSRGHDYKIDAAKLGTGGPKAKAQANLEAIRTLKAIEAENRPATREEQEKLVQFVGWGSLPQLFTYAHRDYYQPEWKPIREELEELLTSDELQDARHSTINAHYTAVPVVKAMWDAVERMGVLRHARILEPAAGIGHFFGLQPSSMLPASRTAVELDSLSGRIAKLLYPNAAVVVKGLQETSLPREHYDLAISNVPFANVSVSDPAYRKHPEVLGSLHDYFFAKALDQIRPGGLVAFITTRYTMDKLGDKLREYLAERAELVGAIRLPNTAFKANAGTEVVTDIVFLRKRLPGEAATGGEAWMALQEIEVPGERGKREKVKVNEYFVRHPEMVLGEHAATGSMYREGEYTVRGELAPEALAGAVGRLPEGVVRAHAEAAAPAPVERIQAEGDAVKQGAYEVKDGKLLVRRGEFFEPASVSAADEPRIRGMVGVRNAARAVLNIQLEDASDAALKTAQKVLGRYYDEFVRKHGPLSDRKNVRAFEEDPDAPLLRALESWDPDTKTATKAAIFTNRTIERYKPVDRVEKADEALAVTLNETGRLDWARMESLTGHTREQLQEELGALVFQNPSGHAWETADAYLSGDVRKKLREAEAAAAADPAYERNVEALKMSIPTDLRPSEINARLGSPWIPPADVERFIAHLLDLESYAGRSLRVAFAKELGLWAVAVPDHGRHSVKATETWGTKDVPAHELIADALNMRQPTVRRRDADKTYVDQGATLAAREKQWNIQEEFRRWLWDEPARADRLARKYNDEFNNIRGWKPDGSHLKLPGMVRTALRGGDLAPHQKNGVWRIMQATPKTNVLLNHAVGAGKTYATIAGIMERIRVGLSKKAAVNVPNHLIAQWGEAFRNLYPAAKVLMVDKKHVTPSTRQQLMSKIATGNYDAVVMSFEALGKLPVKNATYKRFVEGQIAELESAILGAREAAGPGAGRSETKMVKELEKARDRMRAKLDDYLSKHSKDDAVSWEDLGIDLLAVDEAQGFKRLDTPSKMQVSGIARGGSQRAMDLYMKARYLNERGGVLVFATGTPITNTLGEAFVIQKYLQPEMLKDRGIEHFDAWAANFGEARTSYEYDVTGNYKQRTRFAKFLNVTDLSVMLGETMDTMLAKKLKLPVPESKIITHLAPASPSLTRFIQELAKRAERVRNRSVDPRTDNYLKITTDGRKAGTDMRLVDPHHPDAADSKINMAVANIFDIWKKTAARKATQIVFLDLSTPKERRAVEKVEAEPEDGVEGAEEETGEEHQQNVTLYEDIRSKLVAKGIPRDEIVFIHDVKTDVQKNKLNRDMGSGRVRVLIGSTEKMGTGLNVQPKLSDLHLIAPPWRPDQIEQAEGRIVRQGNEHYDLKIPVGLHRYATEGSYDAVMWQILENKAGFIGAFLSAEPGIREVEDVGQVTLSFAQMKALAAGNPKILEKVALDGEVEKLSRLERQHQDTLLEQRRRLQRLEGSQQFQTRQLAALKADADRYAEAKGAAKDFSMQVGKEALTDREEAGTALLETVVRAEKNPPLKPEKIGEFLGFPITLVFRDPTFGKAGKLQPLLQVDGTYDATIAVTPAGTVASIESVLRNLEGRHDGMKGLLAKTGKEIADLKDELGKPFPHAEKLARMKKRQIEIDKELSGKEDEKADALGTGTEDVEGEAAGGGAAPPGKPPRPGAPGAEMPEPPETTPSGGLSGAAEQARARIKGRGRGQANDLGTTAAQGAGTLADLGIIGADLISQGVRKFGAWSRRMLADFGGLIGGLGRYLRAIWRAAQQRVRGAAAPATVPRTRPTTTARPGPRPVGPPAGHGAPPGTRAARPSMPSPGGARLSVESRAERLARQWIDKMGRAWRVIEDIREQGGNVRAGDLFKTAARLVQGKASERLADVERDFVKPLVQKLHAAKVPLEDLGDYLQLLHRQRRDAVIAARTNGKNQTGSGWTAQEARARWAELEQKYGARANGKIAKLEPMADIVRSMRDEQIRVLIDGGLISQQQARAWRNTMGDDYVPLRHFEAEEGLGTGQGFKIRGPEAERAKGRSTIAENPVAFMLEQLNRAIVRAEKNKADQHFGEFVENNNLFRRGQGQPVGDADFVYKKAGVEHRIDIKSVDPLLDRALKNLSAEETKNFVHSVGRVTRALSQLWTTYSPEFLFRNLARDLQTTAAAVTAEQGAAAATKTVKGVPGAIRGMWRSTRKPSANPTGWEKYANDFREDGGPVGFYQLKDAVELGKSLEAQLRASGSDPLSLLRNTGQRLGAFISDANKAVENGSRLSLYRALREAGMAREKAALAAKNVTVNFEQKGEYGAAVNSLYAFFNAGLQGTARLYEVMLKNPKGRAIGLGLLAGGFALDQVNRAVSEDSDDDGINDYDDIPEYVKERNLVLMTPGKPLLVPMPYGLSTIINAGRLGSAVGAGALQPAEAGVSLAAGLWNSFNPLGGERDLVQVLAPTVLDPLVQHSINRDFLGRPIVPEGFPNQPAKPDSETFFRNVPSWARETAQWLNQHSGGDHITPGYVDVSPETIEHYFNFVGNGLGRFGTNLGETAASVSRGEAPELRNVPVVRSFAYEESPGHQASQYRDNIRQVEELYDRYRRYRAEGNSDRIRAMDPALLRVIPRMRTIEKAIDQQRERAKKGYNVERRLAELYALGNRTMTEALQ